MEMAITAKLISKSFGDFKAIDEISLSIPKGTIFGFLGPNGCGKTTAIRMLTGLLIPTNGSIDVLNHSLPKESEKLKYKIGYMTQKFSLYNDLTVEENLKFIGGIFGLKKQNLKEKIEKQLNTYNLTEIRKKRVGGMSGGQKQRVSLAAATIHNPELLFLDEPTSAVDPETRRNFWEQLFDLSESGTTILVATHYMDEAERCHNLAIMEAGKVKAQGNPNDLMNDLSVNVVELLVNADNNKELKLKLSKKENIKSISQLGKRLRVLVKKEIKDPISWLKQETPDIKNIKMELVRPSLEDVFVSVTGEGRQ
ncbi:MAG: ABC transporter ATP-binding protein [Chloroflexi bacterium]|nr:ABC transporter ATP-binding protein [Chloroflexota bacterium]|tara:strand:- start:19015 stop:19944 length:930 start_codon:yes stop_codon:yes gene_type:complete